jgi:hypothetical protein
MSGKGFVAVYRWRVEPEHREAFESRWREVTARLRAHGGLGSLLGRSRDGEFVAVALWPDSTARETAFAAADDGKPWPPSERLEPILIDPDVDMWDLEGWREHVDGE